MDSRIFTVPVPAWAQEALEHVHAKVREALPETLQSFWDDSGFGLAGFDRQPLRPYLVLLVAHPGGKPHHAAIRFGGLFLFGHFQLKMDRVSKSGYPT